MHTIDDEIAALEEAVEEKRRSTKSEKEPCPDGEHSQRVIGEEELASLLSERWHASLVLPSGKVWLPAELFCRSHGPVRQ